MNKKGADVFRILLGCYLIFIGICLWIQVSKENPSNEQLMTLSAVILIIAGLVYVLSSLKRLTGFSFSMLKKRKPVQQEDSGTVPYSDGGIRQKKNFMNNVKLDNEPADICRQKQSVEHDPESHNKQTEKFSHLNETAEEQPEKKQVPFEVIDNIRPFGKDESAVRETRVIEKIEDMWIVSEDRFSEEEPAAEKEEKEEVESGGEKGQGDKEEVVPDPEDTQEIEKDYEEK